MNIIAEIKSRLRGPIPIFLEAVPDRQLSTLRIRAEAGTLVYTEPTECLMGVAGGGDYDRGRQLHSNSARAELAFQELGGYNYQDFIRNRKVLPMIEKELTRRFRVVTKGELVAK